MAIRSNLKQTFTLALVMTTAAVLFSSCSIRQALNLKDCHYEYSSIDNITFNKMNSSELLSFAGIAKVLQFIKNPQQDATIGFTVHMKVTNPNQGTAAMERLFYTVALDSVEIGEGCSTVPFEVLGGTSADLPLSINMNINQLTAKENRPVLTKTLKNFIGRGDEPTMITVNLRPVIRVAGVPLGVPKAIPLRFSYSGSGN